MNPIGILLATTMTIAALMANANERAMRKQAAKSLGTDRIEKAWENSKATVAAYNRDGGGFAITATDGALVGYSDSGTFSKATAPAALIELLEYPHGFLHAKGCALHLGRAALGTHRLGPERPLQSSVPCLLRLTTFGNRLRSHRHGSNHALPQLPRQGARNQHLHPRQRFFG